MPFRQKHPTLGAIAYRVAVFVLGAALTNIIAGLAIFWFAGLGWATSGRFVLPDGVAGGTLYLSATVGLVVAIIAPREDE